MATVIRVLFPNYSNCFIDESDVFSTFLSCYTRTEKGPIYLNTKQHETQCFAELTLIIWHMSLHLINRVLFLRQCRFIHSSNSLYSPVMSLDYTFLNAWKCLVRWSI